MIGTMFGGTEINEFLCKNFINTEKMANEKIVLVTGANKGIGFGIAKHLGLSGWNVIISARDEQRAEKAICELKAAGVNVLGYVNIELKDLNGINQATKEISENYPNLSLLVNNAGIPGDMSVDSAHTELNDIRETLDVNFIGTWALTKALLPVLANNNGRIVNITVPSEISPYWHPLAYDGNRIPTEQYARRDFLSTPRSHYHRPEWQHVSAWFPRYRDCRSENSRTD